MRKSSIRLGRSKVEMLVATNAIKRLSDGSYEVKSNSTHRVDADGCSCIGFKNRGTCSHVLAVKELMKKVNRVDGGEVMHRTRTKNHKKEE